MNNVAPTLTIVIPALNEEEAIGQTIQRCLDARTEIQESGAVGEIQLIVVSDGSTDRTVEIAKEYADNHEQVKLIVFEKNRGYGAAIKEGFRVGGGDLVAFLDADGTCDPRFFGKLCAALQAEVADVALGNRMGADSQMPRVRRLGNRFFALLLGFLSGEAVTDTASGMRVLRRRALAELYPLPDRLDFTPAMSARAVLQRLRIIEVPMPYFERVGESKLRAVRDGLRYLRTIFDAVLFHYPSRLFTLGFGFCTLLLIILAVSPLEFYLQNGMVEEWMIYRFVACLLLGTVGFILLCTAVIADELFFLTNRRRRWRSFRNQLLHRVFSKKALLGCSVLAIVLGVVLVWPGILQYLATGHVTLHWSRVIVAAFGFLFATECVVTASLLRMVSLWKEYLASAQLDGRRASVDTTDPRAALAESNNTPSPDASAVCR